MWVNEFRHSGSIPHQRLQLGIKAGIDEFSASARINQYERGKHTPAFSTVERLPKVLKLPTPFFYCRDDELAEWILAHKRLARPERQLILKRIRPDR